MALWFWVAVFARFFLFLCTQQRRRIPKAPDNGLITRYRRAAGGRCFHSPGRAAPTVWCARLKSGDLMLR